MDEEVLDAMKSAGYYMIRLGIETAGEKAAQGMDLMKKFNVPRLKQLMEHGTNIGLNFTGHLLLAAKAQLMTATRKP